MFSLTCAMAALLCAANSSKEYRFISALVAYEFLTHYITYNFLLLDLRSGNSSLIYALYMLIQADVLYLIYLKQAHKIIALLIFVNLVYNFCTIMQHLHITSIGFHEKYADVARYIMVLELLYLTGVTAYGLSYVRKFRFLSTDYINRMFRSRRRVYNWNLGGKSQ